jgi:hypothetical protein
MGFSVKCSTIVEVSPKPGKIVTGMADIDQCIKNCSKKDKCTAATFDNVAQLCYQYTSDPDDLQFMSGHLLVNYSTAVLIENLSTCALNFKRR